jgi:hypothetical protein
VYDQRHGSTQTCSKASSRQEGRKAHHAQGGQANCQKGSEAHCEKGSEADGQARPCKEGAKSKPPTPVIRLFSGLGINNGAEPALWWVFAIPQVETEVSP